MNIKELIKIFEYVQKKYPNEDMYIKCLDGWEWSIKSNSNDMSILWDNDKIHNFGDFIKNIKEIDMNYIDKQ